MPIRWAYLKRVTAGSIFGLYMAHLLYFLNPQIDVAPGRLAGITLIYCLICGIFIGTALWLLRALRVRVFGRASAEGDYRPHGFGFVVLAAFIASAVYWIHLYAVRIYLPIGAVRLLGKATNLITATAFALLILWFFERNADRATSRALFIAGVALIAISSFFLYERRDSYRTEKRTVVVANVGTVAGERPVIFVAIRNLPYDWIVTIAGEGNLPFFDEVRQRSYFARMQPFPTTSQQSLWASLATGKLPYRHGVTGEYSYRMLFNSSDPSDRFLLVPSGVGFHAWGLIPPVQRISTPLPTGDALPVWSLFERISFGAAVVNWPGVTGGASTVIPARYVRGGRGQIVPRALAQRFSTVGAARDQVLAGLAADQQAIASLRTVVKSDHDELCAVALEGFSQAQRAMHIYRNDLPPRDSPRGAALRAYVEQLDALLRGVARDMPDHLLVLVSPSGPNAPELRSSAWAVAKESLLSQESGADDGFVVIKGAVVSHAENPAPAYVIDVVPTLLFAAGLPVGRDMDGRVLIDAFDDSFLRRNPLSLIPTYEAKQIEVRRAGM